MGIALPVVENITVAEWLSEELYPSYYANRDVNKRMGREHLKGAVNAATQCVVSCAEMDGIRMKIDGHSRAEAWRREQLEAPSSLVLMVYKVESLGDMATLYRTFNSRDAAETATEYMYHLKKLANFEPKSAFLKPSLKYTFGLLGYRGKEGEGLKDYREELDIIDGWDYPNFRGNAFFGVPTKAAMLKSLKQDKESALSFWSIYGDPDNSTCAEVNRLRESVETNGISGGVSIGMVYATALGCFQTYSDKQK